MNKLLHTSITTALLLASTAAHSVNVTSLQVTGGDFSMAGAGGTINPADFANMTIGGYDGSAPSTTGTEASYVPTSIATFAFGFFGPVATYTAETDGLNSGFAAPTGDITSGVLTLDMSAWTAWWNGTAFNQGSKSSLGATDVCVNTTCSTPIVISAYDSVASTFTATWGAVVVGGAFNGQLGSWTVTGNINTLEAATISLTVDHNSLGSDTLDLGLAAGDAEGDTVTLAACNTDADPAKGTVTTGTVSNSCHYTPVADFIGTDTFTYTVTDSKDTVSGTVNVTVRDSEAPVVSLNNSFNGATNAVVKLNNTYTDTGATAVDNLDGVLTPTETGNTVNIAIETPAVTPYQVTWSATDAAGNTGSSTRNVYVDATGPVITVNPGPATHEATTTYIDSAGATASDVIDTASGYTTSLTDDSTTFDTLTLGAQNVTYTATDEAGNITSATRSVTVVDTTPPTIVLVPSVVQYNVNDTYNDTTIVATATDSLDANVSASCTNDSSTVANMTTANSFTVTYTCSDLSSNSDTALATINVVAGNPPVITLPVLSPLQHEAGSIFTAPVATASDIEDGVIVVPPPTGTVDINTVGDYILTYSVIDSNSNPASVDLTVQVRDTVLPVIVLNTSGDISAIDHEINTPFTDPGATVTDSFDTTVTVSVAGSIDVTALGSTGNVLTYTASDASGNAAVARTLTVTIIDTTLPVVTLIGSASLTIDQDAIYTDQGATATDNSGETLTASCSAIDTSTVGVQTVTCSATDSSGNTGTATRSVTVADVLAPVITLNGSDINLNLGDTYSELGATALDNVDGSVTVNISGTVNTSIPGTYTLTYSATDSASNSSSATRNINVIDNIGPVITLNGLNPMTVNAGDSYVEPGATATDNIDGTLSVSISGTVDTSALGPNTITYTATDAAGTTTTITRTVNVIDESTPVLTLNGIGTLFLATGDTYTEEGATAIDNLDGDITGNIIVTSDNTDLIIPTGNSVILNTAGTYTLTYSITDSESQTSTADRTITVAALVSNTPDDNETTLESFGCSMTDIPSNPVDHSEWLIIAGFLGFMSIKRRKANKK